MQSPIGLNWANMSCFKDIYSLHFFTFDMSITLPVHITPGTEKNQDIALTGQGSNKVKNALDFSSSSSSSSSWPYFIGPRDE